MNCSSIDDRSLKLAKIARDNEVFGIIPQEPTTITLRKFDGDKLVGIFTAQLIRTFKEGKLCYCQSRISISNNDNIIIKSVDILSLVELIRGDISHLL